MMTISKLSQFLPYERWSEFFDQFSNRNRRRLISIEILDSTGNQILVQNLPLITMVYDCPGKGDDLVIEVGKEDVSYAHTIGSPTDILMAQNAIGEIISICVWDASKRKTLIKLKSGELNGEC